MTQPGSHVREFETIALQSKLIRFSLRIDLSNAYVVITFISYGPGDVARVQAGYDFYYGPNYKGKKPALTEKRKRSTTSICRESGGESYYWQDTSIPISLSLLVKDWERGTPDFESIQVESKQSPVKRLELEQLVLATCLEVFGQEVPAEKELVKRAKLARQKRSHLRTQCFEWLSSGREGVAKWNDLKVDECKAVGKLGKCQFSGFNLAGVYFGNQDLRGSDFHDANLKQAHFGGADCRDVDFSGAKLTAARLAGGKFLQANFSSADCRKVIIRAADCRGAIFSGADLSGADCSFADLRNVDLSAANLKRANLFRVMYDEQTRLPADFVIHPKLRMEWKGAVQRKAGYTSACSLDELLALIPAPRTPRGAKGNWEAAESELGFHFPSDFKRLFSIYGSGCILGTLEIYNPLTKPGRKHIANDLEALQEVRQMCGYLWPIHPEKAGLLPWGRDINGNIFCWVAKGKPDKWPTAQLGHNAEEPESDNVNITTFLFNYARNLYPEMRGGQSFTAEDYKFSPS